MLTVKRLKELFTYDPKTGSFFRLVTTHHLAVAGTLAGCRRKDGYRVIRIDGHLYRCCRLAWLYMTGEWPAEEVDHKNTFQKWNDSWDNLRLATHAENGRNRRKSSNNTSGYKGVSFNKPKQAWQAQIQINSHALHLGYFDSPAQAHVAYLRAAREHHGEFFSPG